jgi:hypothetical protein
METRTAPIAAVAAELRATGDAAPRFHGTAIVYNQRTAIGNPASWGWYEEIAPGCASKTLAESDVRFLVDHESQLVVARTSAGTLQLTDTAAALEVDADLDQRLSYVADLAVNLETKNVTGMSFGFYVVKDEWTTETVTVTNSAGADTEIEVEVRRILEIRLVEVSAVTFPAYDMTDAGLRSMCADVRSIARGVIPPAAARKLAGCMCGDGSCTCADGTCLCPTGMCDCANCSAQQNSTKLPDPSSGGTREPAAATRENNDDEPAAATRSDEEHDREFRRRAILLGQPITD